MKLDFLPAKLSFKKYSFLKTSCPQVFRLNSQEDLGILSAGCVFKLVSQLVCSCVSDRFFISVPELVTPTVLCFPSEPWHLSCCFVSHIVSTLSPTVVSFTGILKRLFSICYPLCPPLEPCNIVSQLSFDLLPTISLLFLCFLPIVSLVSPIFLYHSFTFPPCLPLTFQFSPNCLPLCLTAVCTSVFVLTLSPSVSLA